MFYKEVDKNTLAVIFNKTIKLLDCALIGACAVIRSITVDGRQLQLPNKKVKPEPVMKVC